MAITDKYLVRNRIKELRTGAGMTRNALARAAELDAATVGRIEAGRLVPYDGQLTKIAQALGVEDPETLMEPLGA